MLNYKDWKLVNESLQGVTTLGLAQPQSLGIIADFPTEEELLAEMKKKMKAVKSKLHKKMGMGDEVNVDVKPEKDGEEEDGEVVEPSAKKDANPDADKEAEDDSEDMDDKEPMGDGDSDDDVEHEEDGDSAEEGGLEKKPVFAMMKKGKKGKKSMKKEEFKPFTKDKKDEKSEKDDKKDNKKDKKPVDKTEKDCKDGKKEMKKEEAEWMASVKNMMSMPKTTHWDGFSPLEKIEVGIRDEGEPQAGEVGFAPQSKMGMR